MKDSDVKKLLNIGVMLSAERDINRLLERILDCVMDLASCDAGTLYLLDNNALHFRIMRNRTLKTYSGANGVEPDLPPVALTRESVCALSVLDEKTIRIEDVRSCQEYDLTGPIRYDAMTGYNTVSMLVVPMRNREGETIGVLQLINAMDEAGNICAFSDDMTLVLESVASQAAITLQNVRYIGEIKELFHSLVRVLSSAVDERTPYNGSHTRHMAACGSRFLDYLNTLQSPPPFPPNRKEELLMSVWFHDVGKLVTPLEVMNKMARLLPEQYTAFTHRMEVIRLRAELDCLSGQTAPEEKEELIRQTREAAELVDSVNGAGFLQDEKLEAIARLRQRVYTGPDGEVLPYLTEDEYAMLSIRKGTLSDAEREIMEEHVLVTDKLLSQIRFSSELSHVREWASAHHELLNGSGYPRHRKGDEIPCEVRIITILDIFDALVADDRPYKPGMPVERALSILDIMANKEGKLDPELTRLFIESKCWESDVPREKQAVL